jgi:hypothetical protein
MKYETESARKFRKALESFRKKGPEVKLKALRNAGLLKSK